MTNPYMKLLGLLFVCSLLSGATLFAQVTPVTYTANDVVKPYEGHFRYGMNLGYFPGWNDRQLGTIAAGDPDLGVTGVGANAFRPGLPNHVLEIWGYDLRREAYDYFESLGMSEHTVILEGPPEWFRDLTYYCEGSDKTSVLFRNVYLDIWDNGENGTPVNDENFFALYVYKIVEEYGNHMRFYEIWNEPDFDFSFTNWNYRNPDIGWWVEDPDPCDYQLRAPIQHYVRHLRVAYEVIKTLDDDAYVSIGALGYPHFLDAVLRNTDNPQGGSITADYPLTGGAYFDVMGFHEYPHIDGSLWQYDYRVDDAPHDFARHSDQGVDNGIFRKYNEFNAVLAKYGYDGTTYPEKLWLVTESNMPRKGFGDWRYHGSEEMQYNYIIKAAVGCQKVGILQLHPFNLGDKQSEEDATFEFDLMGMYKKLANTPQYEQEVNNVGIAYKTVSDLLYEYRYDETATAALMMPAGVDGGAFRNDDGAYTYVLWSKTHTDQSEETSATYSFPSNMVGDVVTSYPWDWSYNGGESEVSSRGIALTGTPVFFRSGTTPIVDNAIDLELALTSDKQAIEKFEKIDVTITVENNSTLAASDVVVEFAIPSGKMAYVSHEATTGTYRSWTGEWIVGNMAPNSSETLTVRLFTLTDETTIYAQVVDALELDADSTPDNGNGTTATEDDEATYTFSLDDCVCTDPYAPVCADNVTYFNACEAACAGITNYTQGECATATTDVELSMTATPSEFLIYSNVTFQLTVSNTGNRTAEDVRVEFPIPQGRLAYVGHSNSQGDFNVAYRHWNVGDLAPGASATFDLTLFTLVNEPINVFAEVIMASPSDIDSSPDNGNGMTAQEDDEASMTINPAGNFNNGSTLSSNLGIFPNPTTDRVNVYFNAVHADVELRIVDTNGKVVRVQAYRASEGVNQARLDVADLPSGVYSLQIKGNTDIQQRLFVKE